MRNLITTIVAAVAAAGALSGCSAFSEADKQFTDTVGSEQSARNNSYENLVRNQPAIPMPYSPTRDTINGWVKTWGQPGKVSYVYLQNAEGKLIGYYVLKGLPVSYCSGNVPNYQVFDDSDGNLLLPAPGQDGTYESSGAACNTYYGFDAGTGAYVEYTAGLGINVLLYDQPLPQSGSIPPLGPTTADRAPGEPIPTDPTAPVGPAKPGQPR